MLFRLLNYVHALGPLRTASELGFYDSSRLLQAPRIAMLNQRAGNLMHLHTVNTYDSSVVHAARPEATRDKLHWGRIHSRHTRSSSFEELCQGYCSGKWIRPEGDSMGRFMLERDIPVLAFSSLQLTLAAIMKEKHRANCCSMVPVLEQGSLTHLPPRILDLYRSALLDPPTALSSGLRTDYLTEAATLLALVDQDICIHA